MRASQRNKRTPPMYGGRVAEPLTIKSILQWIDEYKLLTGTWPKRTNSRLGLPTGETWTRIDAALWAGTRGLTGRQSLSQILRKYRGVVPTNASDRPSLTAATILAWADKYHRRYGEWPTKNDGEVDWAPSETWLGIDNALLHGTRELPGNDSLTWFLHRHRGKPYNIKSELLSIDEIRLWARWHYARTGRWPSQSSGDVVGVPGERWGNIQSALYKGSRGLPGGSSIPKVLADLKRAEAKRKRTKATRRHA